MAGAHCAALRGLIALAAAVMMCSEADASDCATVESVSVLIQRQSGDVEIRIVSDLAADRIRAGISALAGQQVWPGGQYLLAHVPGASTTYVVRFENSCATHHGRFPHELVRTWIDGSPA